MSSSNLTAYQGLVSGPVIVGGGMESIPITSNISWNLAFNPYDQPGYTRDNLTHTVCISSDETVQAVCCSMASQNASYFVDLDGNNLGSSPANVTDATTGLIHWCTLPNSNTYNDHYNSEPEVVSAYKACFDSTVPAASNAGDYATNVTVGRTILWQCELTGNFSGGNSYGIPRLTATSATSGARRRLIEDTGARMLLAVVGLMTLMALATVSG